MCATFSRWHAKSAETRASYSRRQCRHSIVYPCRVCVISPGRPLCILAAIFPFSSDRRPQMALAARPLNSIRFVFLSIANGSGAKYLARRSNWKWNWMKFRMICFAFAVNIQQMALTGGKFKKVSMKWKKRRCQQFSGFFYSTKFSRHWKINR